jgi:hypothetical protein
MLLDEAVAKADSATHPAKDLPLDSPFQKVRRAWRELANPSEAAVGDHLLQHEPSTIAQRQVQPQAQRKDQPKA